MKRLLQSLIIRWMYSPVPCPSFLQGWVIRTRSWERLYAFTAREKGGRA